MEITLFAKTAHKADGTPFTRFIGRMPKKDGSIVNVTVRAIQDIPQFSQKKCPYIIEFDKKDANMQSRTYTDKDGNVKTSYTLWLKAYKESDKKFVDHSLDEFE